jgi:hypothetical protein
MLSFLIIHTHTNTCSSQGCSRFGSVRFLSKKVTKPIFFLKKTETEPKPVQTDRFRFGSVFKRKNRFKPVWLCFSVWLGFFPVFFSVRFGSVFPVPGLKNQNRTEPVGFFKNLIGLIGFFLRFDFFGYCFSGFLGLIGFSVFLNIPML